MISRSSQLRTLRCSLMNDVIFRYVKRFYLRRSREYTFLCHMNLSDDEFFENWTINIKRGQCDTELVVGTIVSTRYFRELVENDVDSGFFIKETSETGVRYHISELGRSYIEFKVSL